MNTQTTRYNPICRDYTNVKLAEARELRRNMTPAERRLWHALRGERLSGLHFRRQQPLRGFIVDFYCHRLRLVIEIDGSIHDSTIEYDAERTKILNEAGMTLLRFRNEQVFQNIGAVLYQITQVAYQIASAANAEQLQSFPFREGAP